MTTVTITVTATFPVTAPYCHPPFPVTIYPFFSLLSLHCHRYVTAAGTFFSLPSFVTTIATSQPHVFLWVPT